MMSLSTMSWEYGKQMKLRLGAKVDTDHAPSYNFGHKTALLRPGMMSLPLRLVRPDVGVYAVTGTLQADEAEVR